jgi:two-component system, sensor histidine kinase and response regulator
MIQHSDFPQIVLVVDDDALIREALRRQLRRAGYFMESAESGAKALEYAEWSAADLVILDLKMPHMDGFETCRKLKAVPGWENIPVLILTGDQKEADYEAAIDAGADDFLTKPVLFQELMLRVHSLLRIRRYLADLRESVKTIEAQREVILRDKAMREKLQAFLLHDLKNPISSILLQAEMKVDVSQPATVDDQDWGRVLHHTERLMKLVTGWMDFMRSEEAGLHPRLVKVETQTFLQELLHRHSIWFQVRHLKGAVRVEDELSEISMDPTIMDRVLGNLLENCIRYSPDGGEILIEAKRANDAHVRLEVSDRGPGIPFELQRSIFDMYVQLEAASSQTYARESRGLGLAFCRMAAEAHGGKIWAEDNPAGGTRFVIEMPLNH